MLALITAFPSEARPLIDAFRLKRFLTEAPFAVYRGDDVFLIVSGIGIAASACAVGFLRGQMDLPVAWLNVGIAGHGSLAVGEAMLANKITDAASGRNWYPPRVFPWDGRDGALVTVAQPQTAYTASDAFDMEAAGFYPAACRFINAELVQCLKIISDCPLSPLSSLDNTTISNLVHKRIDTALQLVEILQSLCLETTHKPPGGTLYEKILHQTRFSQTQKQQLKNHLHRLALLAPQAEDEDTIISLADAQSAAQILWRLEARLNTASQENGHG